MKASSTIILILAIAPITASIALVCYDPSSWGGSISLSSILAITAFGFLSIALWPTLFLAILVTPVLMRRLAARPFFTALPIPVFSVLASVSGAIAGISVLSPVIFQALGDSRDFVWNWVIAGGTAGVATALPISLLYRRAVVRGEIPLMAGADQKPPNPMQRFHRRIKIALFVLALAGIIAGVLAFRRWQAVSYLQSQFGRAWEISYNVNGSPPMLPTFLETRADDYLWKKYGSDEYPKNYPELLKDRFESLFLGRIKTIDIWYPAGIGHDLGGALKAFGSLENLWIMDGWDRPVEEVENLAETLADLDLRRLALSGFHTLSPNAIRELSRSKSLRELKISEAEITPEAMDIFARWATLEKLVLNECKYDPEALAKLQKVRPGLVELEGEDWGYCRVP